MNDWTAGYVADIGYTFGYYTELNPLRVKLAFLNQGLVFPEVGTACELGFGQGLSANFHAASSITQWHGTDFNPAQAGFAQELGRVSGAEVHLYDDAFADFARRDDLPEFDYIGLHGIWSWISDENRATIVDFIRRKLKVGGVLYISYNTLPGWGAFAPMRHLMTTHAETVGSEGHGIVSRIEGALGFAEKLLATNPLYSRANPQVTDRVNKIKGLNRNYLAHEFFNRDWCPMHFATMTSCLQPAKLDFACSAHYLDQVDVLNLTNEQQEFLREIPDLMFRQSVRDFMVNQQFRRDYWVKGARKLTVAEQLEGMRKQKVVLQVYRPDVSLKVNGDLGEATLSESVYTPILDFLSDHQVKTLGQIEAAVKCNDVTFPQIMQVAIILAGAGHIAAVQHEETIAKAEPNTRKLNAYLILKSRYSGDVGYLASPLTGGGISVNRISQLFLLAIDSGLTQPVEWTGYVWKILSEQGDSLVKEGQPLLTQEENLAELTELANTFAEKQWPILKALQIAR